MGMNTTIWVICAIKILLIPCSYLLSSTFTFRSLLIVKTCKSLLEGFFFSGIWEHTQLTEGKAGVPEDKDPSNGPLPKTVRELVVNYSRFLTSQLSLRHVLKCILLVPSGTELHLPQWNLIETTTVTDFIIWSALISYSTPDASWEHFWNKRFALKILVSASAFRGI